MKLPRWLKWWYVVLFAAPLVQMAIVIVIATFITGDNWSSLMDSTAPYSGWLGMAWLVWACPVLEAGSASKHMRQRPLRFRRRLRQIVWTPTIIGMPIVIAMAGLAFMVAPELRTKPLILAPTIGPPVILLGSWLADKLVCRRFNATLRSMKICVNCGYDLRGSLGPACPECGEPMPPGNEKTGVT